MMITNNRTIARLVLQIERGKIALDHLTAMALEARNALDARRRELRTARAILAAQTARKKR